MVQPYINKEHNPTNSLILPLQHPYQLFLAISINHNSRNRCKLVLMRQINNTRINRVHILSKNQLKQQISLRNCPLLDLWWLFCYTSGVFGVLLRTWRIRWFCLPLLSWGPCICSLWTTDLCGVCFTMPLGRWWLLLCCYRRS